jgi:hypothetical protein
VTPVEAAHRLGVHETAVRTVEDRENDSVVTLRAGSKMLVSETVARAYVPEVDDVPTEADITDPDDAPKKPAEAPKKAATRTSKAA